MRKESMLTKKAKKEAKKQVKRCDNNSGNKNCSRKKGQAAKDEAADKPKEKENAESRGAREEQVHDRKPGETEEKNKSRETFY